MATVGVWAAEAPAAFDIPAGDATRTLKQFSAQSGQQVLYSYADLEAVRTNAVKGSLSAEEALNQLLAGTPLVASRDANKAAFAVGRLTAEKPSPNGPRAAQTAEKSDRPKVSTTEASRVVLEALEVTGSRLRLNSGERPTQPVFTLTSVDIGRTGASTLGQLLQYIPAVTSYSSGSAQSTGNFGTSGFESNVRTSAQLRGGSQTGTLLLVDGKRVPKTGQSTFPVPGSTTVGGATFDLGGIPLSAVDRVEVLLDGASAIYGSDAIYGVINVILKKRYVGTEVRLHYDNTFVNDAAERTASLTHGFSLGKWSGLVTVSVADNHIQQMQDRVFTSSYDRTLFGGTANNSGLAQYFGGAGGLSVNSGVLPGLTVSAVAIPTGSTGQNLTVASFAAASLAPPQKLGVLNDASNSFIRDQSGYLKMSYEFSDDLQLTGSVRSGKHWIRDNGVYRRAQLTTLPAGYPGNPFGIPVLLSKVFWDLPRNYSGAVTRNSEISFALDGKLPGDWQYEASVNYVRGTNDSLKSFLDPVAKTVATANLSRSALNAAIAAGRTPLLVYDSRQSSPNPPGALNELFSNSFPSYYSELSQVWTYAAQANGKLLRLPAGDVQAAAGGEFRRESIAFPGYYNPLSPVFSPGAPRKVEAVYAEFSVPLVAPTQHWLLLRQLDLTLAGRVERYNDAGTSSNPRYGVAWRPAAGLLLRGAYGTGFLVPPLIYTRAPQTVSNAQVFDSTLTDPRRGNQSLYLLSYTSTNAASARLKPQHSENATFGVVWDVPRWSGVSLSFDYFDNRYRDRFGSINMTQAILVRPDLITRGAALPGDLPGWAGPVIAFDQGTINIAQARVSGYDFGFRWNQRSPWGELTFSSNGERILRDVAQTVPGAVPDPKLNKKYDALRVTSTLFWSHGSWDAGVIALYGGRYWVDTANATVAASRYTSAVTRWDVTASYDFDRDKAFGSAADAWWRRALRSTKWQVTIVDVFNTRPPLDVQGYYSSSTIDARLRRYVVDLTKRF